MWTSIFHLVIDEGFQRESGSIRQVYYEVEERLMGTQAKMWGGLLGEREEWRAAAYLQENKWTKGLPTKVSSIDPLPQTLELCAQSVAPNHLLRQIMREQKPYLDIAK